MSLDRVLCRCWYRAVSHHSLSFDRSFANRHIVAVLGSVKFLAETHCNCIYEKPEFNTINFTQNIYIFIFIYTLFGMMNDNLDNNNHNFSSESTKWFRIYVNICMLPERTMYDELYPCLSLISIDIERGGCYLDI